MITPKGLKSIPPDSLIVIDTRPAWKYFIGHIPDSINIPNWKEFTETRNEVSGLLIQDLEWIAVKLRQLGISNDKTLIIYGDSTDSWRTDGRFFWMFHYYGFKKTALLDGGFEQWKLEDGTSESGVGKELIPSKIVSTDIRLNNEIIADRFWIAERLKSPSNRLIDNRTRKEYDGATPYGSPRGGHIPGAIHIDWRDFFKKDGRLKERVKLIAILNRYGISSEQEIAVYCTGGVRSSMAYFVLKTLNFKVRNYDGSWWDWSHQLAYPTEY